ncbi:hypothetical protein E2562_023437 [Oryza meyeriana var. granulata]|uniref:Uncharacterized protein n=1 Tax=Oryza meyeriana var. granulata TaxID=110450 RepID=A0A6G1FB76_9ORYZ|nr:hypothetical protein E2562_023437 [Oryza meyeriana var. granulata]
MSASGVMEAVCTARGKQGRRGARVSSSRTATSSPSLAFTGARSWARVGRCHRGGKSPAIDGGWRPRDFASRGGKGEELIHLFGLGRARTTVASNGLPRASRERNKRGEGCPWRKGRRGETAGGELERGVRTGGDHG